MLSASLTLCHRQLSDQDQPPSPSPVGVEYTKSTARAVPRRRLSPSGPTSTLKPPGSDLDDSLNRLNALNIRSDDSPPNPGAVSPMEVPSRKRVRAEEEGEAAPYVGFDDTERPRTPTVKRRRIQTPLTPVPTTPPAMPTRRVGKEDEYPGSPVTRVRKTVVDTQVDKFDSTTIAPTSDGVEDAPAPTLCKAEDFIVESFLASLHAELKDADIEKAATEQFSMPDILQALEEVSRPSPSPSVQTEMAMDLEPDGSFNAAEVVCPEPVSLMEIEWIDTPMDVDVELHDPMDIVIDHDCNYSLDNSLIMERSSLDLGDAMDMEIDVAEEDYCMDCT
jgi:hypothetical protein